MVVKAIANTRRDPIPEKLYLQNIVISFFGEVTSQGYCGQEYLQPVQRGIILISLYFFKMQLRGLSSDISYDIFARTIPT